MIEEVSKDAKEPAKARFESVVVVRVFSDGSLLKIAGG